MQAVRMQILYPRDTGVQGWPTRVPLVAWEFAVCGARVLDLHLLYKTVAVAGPLRG